MANDRPLIEKLLLNCCDPVAIHICENCKHAGQCATCLCKERFLDIKNNCEKEDKDYGFCAYFVVV